MTHAGGTLGQTTGGPARGDRTPSCATCGASPWRPRHAGQHRPAASPRVALPGERDTRAAAPLGYRGGRPGGLSKSCGNAHFLEITVHRRECPRVTDATRALRRDDVPGVPGVPRGHDRGMAPRAHAGDGGRTQAGVRAAVDERDREGSGSPAAAGAGGPRAPGDASAGMPRGHAHGRAWRAARALVTRPGDHPGKRLVKPCRHSASRHPRGAQHGGALEALADARPPAHPIVKRLRSGPPLPRATAFWGA